MKHAREAAGLSQLDVSRRVTADTTTISRWENDHLYPGLPRLVELGALYSVAPGWIAFGEGEPPRKRVSDAPAVPT